MIIGIWGQAGTGNSTLAYAISSLLTKNGTVLLIDTDLTQPTLPTMLNGMVIDKSKSLGRALNIGMKEVTTYMHQDKKNKKLFYAGLTDGDNILSYEYGFESISFVERFMESCNQIVDHIVLDLSAQRSDPFLPFTLVNANKILMCLTPNTKGISRYKSYMELIEQFKVTDKVLSIAVQVQSFHDVIKMEQNTDIKFCATIPYLKAVAMCIDNSKNVLDVPKFNRQIKKIIRVLEVEDSE